MFVCSVDTIHLPITLPRFIYAFPIFALHLNNKTKREETYVDKAHTKRNEVSYRCKLICCSVFLHVHRIHRCSPSCHHKPWSVLCKTHLGKLSVGLHIRHSFIQENYPIIYINLRWYKNQVELVRTVTWAVTFGYDHCGLGYAFRILNLVVHTSQLFISVNSKHTNFQRDIRDKIYFYSKICQLV